MYINDPFEFDSVVVPRLDFIYIFTLHLGPVREPPAHLRPGGQHVQEHDHRHGEPVCHHQV